VRLYIGVAGLEKLGHFPSGNRRGYRADIRDGGHRIPLLTRWPGKIKPGSTSDELVSLVDFMATCADITRQKIPTNAGEDSFSLLPALLGTATKLVNEAVVYHSINGSFAIQQGHWKLELCPDSGGWNDPKPDSPATKSLPPMQLYDMDKDVGERTNEFTAQPEIAARLRTLLEKYVKDGRTTPGLATSNDVTVHLIKVTKAKKTKKTTESE
jgi:arylsulfatase A